VIGMKIRDPGGESDDPSQPKRLNEGDRARTATLVRAETHGSDDISSKWRNSTVTLDLEGTYHLAPMLSLYIGYWVGRDLSAPGLGA